MKTVLKKTAYSFALTAGFALVALSTTSVVQAREIQRDQYVNNDRCFKSRIVPARVVDNTRGIPVKGASREWVGNFQRHGSTVVQRYNDPVFITTTTTIEPQHVTLVPVACRGR